jgi:hypothetical protein
MAESMGMAKPTPATERRRKPPELAAVSMPTTWPEVFTSGPPESPGRMPAFTWMRPFRVSALAPVSSVAVMVWPMAVTWPAAALG